MIVLNVVLIAAIVILQFIMTGITAGIFFSYWGWRRDDDDELILAYLSAFVAWPLILLCRLSTYFVDKFKA